MNAKYFKILDKNTIRQRVSFYFWIYKHTLRKLLKEGNELFPCKFCFFGYNVFMCMCAYKPPYHTHTHTHTHIYIYIYIYIIEMCGKLDKSNSYLKFRCVIFRSAPFHLRRSLWTWNKAATKYHTSKFDLSIWYIYISEPIKLFLIYFLPDLKKSGKFFWALIHINAFNRMEMNFLS